MCHVLHLWHYTNTFVTLRDTHSSTIINTSVESQTDTDINDDAEDEQEEDKKQWGSDLDKFLSCVAVSELDDRCVH